MIQAPVRHRLLIVTACTLAGGLWLVLQGPMPVIRVTTPLPEAAPFWYMVLAFPFLGLLLADLIDLYRAEGGSLRTLELAFQTGLILMLSSARLGLRIPLSGHSLLLAYFIFRKMLRRPFQRPSRLELWLAAGALGAVAYAKLVWWNDAVTFFAGVTAGALLAVFSCLVRTRTPFASRSKELDPGSKELDPGSKELDPRNEP